MNSKYLLWGAVAFVGLALSSCQEKEYDYVDQPDEPEFYATIEQAVPDTKVYADAKLRVLWHADDRVSIFNKYTYNNQYAFQGETGANAGVFKKVPNDDFVTGNALDYIYAVYPYQDGTRIDNDGFISLTLPSVQPYAELNFGIGANTMVSVTEDNDLLFKNLGGYIAVKLYGDGVSVSGITLKGNGGEKLAGNAVVTAPLDGAPSVAMADDASGEITLRCASSVTLGATANESTEFWFVLPPTAFTQGFTITVRDSNGRTFEKTTDKSVTIERNHLSRMAAFEVEIDHQPDNEIWYTSKDGNVVTPYQYATDPFGANLVSNTYENGKGVLLFDGPVTRIGSDAFAYGRKLTSIAIPDSVEELGEYNPFYACSGLNQFSGKFATLDGRCLIQDNRLVSFASSGMTYYIIPDEVTEIGNYAFDESNNLTTVVIPEGVTRIGQSAFSYCYALTTVEIPQSVTELGSSPFYSCGSLQSFTGKFASEDGRCLVYEGTLLAFAPSGVTSYVIPNEVTIIGHAAFAYYPITEILIHGNVTSVEWESFSHCSRLTSITVLATVPPVGGSRMFEDTNNCPIYVPAQSLEAYKAAGHWSDLVSRIEALPVHHSAITGATDLSAAQANCFVITAPGAYKFPALKGESTEAVGDVYGAELLWESCNNASEVTLNSVIAEVDYEDNWIYFQTPATLKSGNAVIAAMDYFGNIIWSWHIWIPATTITSNTHGIYNHELMDRNLGALVAAKVGSPAPVESFGLTYQWGRKDPFPGPAATSRNDPATVAGIVATVAEGQISLEESIASPTLLGHINDGDWLTVPDNTLWQNDIKTIYDPCPAGYRVPARDTDQPMMSSDWSTVAGWDESEENAYYCMGNPAAVFPCGGYRDDYDVGEYIRVGLRVEMWTSQNNDDRRGYAFRYRNPSAGNMHAMRNLPKARGCYIRCCKVEEAPEVVPEAVDLGLSVKWANFNLGASAPEVLGDHYAWGETEPKDSYSWANYKWCDGYYGTNTKYNESDGLYALEMEDDAAAVNWGGKWRMPTHKEQEELYSNCNKTLTTLNGVSGYRLTSRKNGNSIFMPLDPNVDPDFPMTFYFSRSLSSPNLGCAIGMSETSSPYSGYGTSRCNGWLIRPIYGDIVPVQSITLDKDALSLPVGDWARIYVSFVPANASEQGVLWSSSDPTIASVDEFGQLHPSVPGTTTITAKSVDSGRTATCVVTVTPAPDAIDLGLSVKWGSYNLGATAPEEYGAYFAWGELEPKRDYSWSNYMWCNGSSDSLTKYNTDSSYGVVDDMTVLDPEDDVAHEWLMGNWRMPTDAEWTELRENCIWTWTTQKGTNGYTVTGPNGNSIFLPAAGRKLDSESYDVGSGGLYWSSIITAGDPTSAYDMFFSLENVYVSGAGRREGFSIRPVIW